MSQNSSNHTKHRDAGPKKAADGRPALFARRIGFAILLCLWVAAGFFLSLFVLGMIIGGLVAIGVPLGSLSESVQNAVFAALSYLLTAVIVIGAPAAAGKLRTSLKELGLDRLPTWQDILLALAGYVVYVLFAVIFLALASRLIPGFDADQVQEVGFSNLGQRYEYLLAFITLVIVAPVAEEILMRGYLYGKLRNIIRIGPAMIVTGLLFGVLHGQWNVAIDVFALSLILTSLREVSDSIWASILVHMIKNGVAFYLLFINTPLLNTIGG